MPASLTDFFATAHEPLVVLNRDGTISLANAGFLRVLGRDPDDLLGLPMAQIFHRTDRDRAAQIVNRAVRTEQPMQLDGRVEHADGGYRWMTWALRKSPDGTVYGLGRDESIRRKIEATVRKRERLNRAMLDHVADILLVVDDELVITDANATAASVIGLSRHLLEGRHLAEFAPLLDHDDLRDLRDGDGLTVESVVQTWNGEFIDVEVRAAGFSFADTSMRVLAARDIRERRAAEHRLHILNGELHAARDRAVAASDAKTRFVTRLSHALRTPLGAILGYSELLQDENEGGPDVRRIHRSASLLLELADDLLDLARIESGRVELGSDLVELPDLFTELQDTLSPRLGSTRLDFRIEADPAELEADHGRLVQLLLALLSAAAHRAPEGTVTLVATDRDDDHIAFEVLDDGPALGPAALEEAFVPFPGREDPRHDGLGLTIARELATAMGGTLEASRADGRNRFTAVLPQSSSSSR